MGMVTPSLARPNMIQHGNARRLWRSRLIGPKMWETTRCKPVAMPWSGRPWRTEQDRGARGVWVWIGSSCGHFTEETYD